MDRPKRRKPRAQAQSKRKHRAKNPLPPVGTVERLEMLRQRHALRQAELGKRRQDSLDELAFGPATLPIVERNGSVIGRVQIDERAVLVEADEKVDELDLPTKVGMPTQVAKQPTHLEKLSISSRICLLRKRRGLSVWMAATSVGISREAWRKLEAGINRPSAGTAIRVARLFDVNVMLLIDGPATTADN